MNKLYYGLLIFMALFIACDKPKKKPLLPPPVQPHAGIYDIDLDNKASSIVDTAPLEFKVNQTQLASVKIEVVEDDGGNVTIVTRGLDQGLNKNAPPKSKIPEKVQTYFNTPMRSLAAQLFNYEKVIKWQPKKRSDINVSGSPVISCCALSEDKSVFAIAEVMGKEKGAKGTRLVFFNTYNQEVLDLTVFEQDLVTHMFFDENKNALICVFAEQEISKRSAKIVVFDFEKKKIIKSVPMRQKAPFSIVYCTQNGIAFIKENDATTILGYHLDNNSTSSVSCSKNATIFVDPLTSQLVLTDNRYIERFPTNNVASGIKNSNPLERPFIKCIFVDDLTMIVSTQEGKLYDITDNKPVLITQHLKGDFVLTPQKKALFILTPYNEEITMWTGSPWKEVSKFSPRKINPRNNYSVVYMNYIPSGNRLFIFDTFANISYCVEGKGMWNKKIVLSPK